MAKKVYPVFWIVIAVAVIVSFLGGFFVNQIQVETEVIKACEIQGDDTVMNITGTDSGNFCDKETMADACRNAKENFNAACQESCEIFTKHEFSDDDEDNTNTPCDADVDQKTFRIVARNCTKDDSRKGFPAIATCVVTNTCNCDP